MSKFRSYHSIENSYKENIVKAIRKHPRAKEECCMIEKIHGSNFQFAVYYDTETKNLKVRVGRRNDYIGEPYEVKFRDKSTGEMVVKKLDPCENFMRADHIRDLYSEKMKNLYIDMFGDCSGMKDEDRPSLIVYGEIFGGFWNNCNTAPWIRVQWQVQYHPENKFMAFDIVTIVPGRERVISYTNYDKCIELFKKHEIPYVPILFRGTFEEVFAKSQATKESDSTIPEIFKLKSEFRNTREGHVIKFIEPVYFKEEPIYLKDKNTDFIEIQNTDKMSKSNGVSDELQKIIDQAQDYVNPQRFENVLSKNDSIPLDGSIEKKTLNMLVNQLIEDALKDLGKDLPKKLPVNDLKVVRKSITQPAFEVASGYCNWGTKEDN